MSEEKKLRAFIALKPPPEWSDPLQELQKKLKTNLPSDAIRWTPIEQIHLTLRFLGYVTSQAVEQVVTAMDGAATSVGSFLLHYDGLGCFPRIRDPRVIWAGLKTDTNNLVDLHQKLNAATQAIGQTPEDRPFKAHLTIARVKNLERKFIPALEAGLDSTEFSGPGEWLVKEVLLMQSHLSPKGARYEALHTVQLK